MKKKLIIFFKYTKSFDEKISIFLKNPAFYRKNFLKIMPSKVEAGYEKKQPRTILLLENKLNSKVLKTTI